MAPIVAEARAAQPSRRRDAPRPSASKRAATTDGPNGTAAVPKRRKLEEPYVRTSAHIMRKFTGRPPSMVIHLHTTHFRFDGQDGSYGYDSPMRFVVQHLRNGTVPHEMLESLHAAKVQFYDGCLIVQVHNHRTNDSKKHGASGKEEDKERYSMHRHTGYVTPSPYVPYPTGGKAVSTTDTHKDDGEAGGKSKEHTGSSVTTVVLHPTEQTKHEEMMTLARTPASALPNKKKGGDANTPATAQSQDQSLSVPPTPIGGPVSAPGEKMALTQDQLYGFHSDMLLATEPPLLLDVPSSAQGSHAMIDMLAHPQHSAKAPPAKERKRTTAEMAAEDAQTAEAERRMLMMDERIKPSAGTAGTAAGDNSASAASLGFTRFKTIDAVRLKHEEADRQKKEEEARLAVEKRAMDEQAQQQQRAQAVQKQRELQMQQQQQAKKQHILAQHQAEQQRQQQMQQHQAQLSAQQANLMQAHAHPNGQHGVQASPVMRQQTQTPMMNSSPMVAQNGFPMNRSASQQGLNGGSPPRPPSAALQQRQQHPGVAMAKNASQQANGSQNNTPHMQSTPSMANAMPGNRQISATPRLQPGSPAVGMQQGTPGMQSQLTPNAMMMQANNHNLQNMTADQMAMLSAQRAANQNGMQTIQTPEMIQATMHLRKIQQELQTTVQILQNAKITGDQGTITAATSRLTMLKQASDKAKFDYQRHRQPQQMNPSGTPGLQQNTPQMNHGHPGQMSLQPNGNDMHQQQQSQLMLQQQQAQQQNRQRHMMQIQSIINQHGGGQIPPQVLAGLPVHLQQMYRQHLQGQQQKMMRARQQQQAMAGGGGGGDYMQNMQAAKMQLALQMQQQQQQGGGNNGGMGQGSPMPQQQQGGGFSNMAGMNGMNMHAMQQQQQFNPLFAQQQQQQQRADPGNLDAQFAAMQAALQQGNGQGQQQQQQQGGGRMQ